MFPKILDVFEVGPKYIVLNYELTSTYDVPSDWVKALEYV